MGLWQGADDHFIPDVPRSLGTTLLARDGQGVRNQLGCGLKAVTFVVDYGLAHRSLEGVTEIGVDEVVVFRGHKYLTLVYQVNAGARRPLWSGPERKFKMLLRFFKKFGPERSAKLLFVFSDMWVAYLKGIAKKAPQAQASDFELVQGQRRNFKRRSRGDGPRGKTRYEKNLRF